MQKILYILLLISVASFGQSDKVKLNTNNDSIYKAVCFTLNDSASDFKLVEFHNSSKDALYEFRLKEAKTGNIIIFPMVTVTEEAGKVLDSNNIRIHIERRISEVYKAYEKVSINKSIVTIGNKYESYLLDMNLKTDSMEIVEKAYILKYKKKFITLIFAVQITKDTPYYLQEFNKLVNTIRFK